MRKYAQDAGVSYTTVYVIENGEYIPSPKMIQKLTSKQANPQNGIKYKDVMNAAGYKTEQDEDMIDEKAREMVEQIVIEIAKSDPMGGIERIINYSRLFYIEQLNNRAKGLIFYVLAKNGMAFSNEVDERSNELKKNELILSIDKGRIRTWKIEFLCFSDEQRNVSMKAPVLFSRLLTYTNTKETKFSVVTNDPPSFANFKKYEHALPFRGDFSVILVDIKVQEILDEIYLSDYFLDDYSDEFYLV